MTWTHSHECRQPISEQGWEWRVQPFLNLEKRSRRSGGHNVDNWIGEGERTGKEGKQGPPRPASLTRIWGRVSTIYL